MFFYPNQRTHCLVPAWSSTASTRLVKRVRVGEVGRGFFYSVLFQCDIIVMFKVMFLDLSFT